MDWLDIEIKFSRQSVKTYKKCLIGNMLILIFNTGFILYDGFSAFHGNSILGAMGAGCFLVNWLWTLLFLIDNFQDYSIEKKALGRYEEFKSERLNELQKQCSIQ